QLAQQQRFKLMGKFLLPLKGLFEIGYAKAYAGQSTLFNQAMGNNLPAVTGDYPDFTIDYSRVEFSRGSLLPPRGIALAAGEHEVTVSWRPSITTFEGKADDDVYILLYDTELRLFYTTDEVVQRSVGQAVIAVDDDTVGHSAEVWLFCVSRDSSQISNTVNGGSVVLASILFILSITSCGACPSSLTTHEQRKHQEVYWLLRATWGLLWAAMAPRDSISAAGRNAQKRHRRPSSATQEAGWQP